MKPLKFIFLLMFLAQGCGGSQKINIEHKIEEGFENHPDAQFCKDFILKTSDLEAFLSESKEVSEAEFYTNLDWSPCYANVAIHKEDEIIRIKVMASKKAIIYESENKYIYCATCSKPFFDY